MLPAAIAKGRTATLDEIAEYLGLTKRVVRNVCRKHGVPVLDTGAQLRFDELAFNALLEALRSRAMASAARIAVSYKPPISFRSRVENGSKSNAAAVLAKIESNLQEEKRRRREARIQREHKK